jgi:hypothetical protein
MSQKNVKILKKVLASCLGILAMSAFQLCLHFSFVYIFDLPPGWEPLREFLTPPAGGAWLCNQQ